MPGRMNINWLPGEEQVLQYDLYDAYYGDPMPAVMKFYEEKNRKCKLSLYFIEVE